jgi:hypothetical protein
VVVHYPKERLRTRGEIVIHPNTGTISRGRALSLLRGITQFQV